MAEPHRNTPKVADPTEACQELLERHGPRLGRLARHLLGQDADDGMQEVYQQACRSLPGFRGESGLGTWFHRLAVRTLCRFRTAHQQRTGREHPAPEPEAQLSARAVAALGQSPLEALDRRERRDRVRTALQRLPVHQRQVLVLRSYQGLRYAEIAELLEVPLGTVKSRIAAASVALAELLHEDA